MDHSRYYAANDITVPSCYEVDILCSKIAQTHFAYLTEEETPNKLEQCQRIEDYIFQYLFIVPHKRKFKAPAFIEILQRTIDSNEFSAYKAVFSFNFIEKYASNLISQPWRKEYHSVKMFGGFYKHNIAKIIPSAHVIFTLMGYKRDRQNDTLTLSGPVDPDKVSRVSLDCLVASLECRILIEIAEKLKGLSWSWKQIYSVRKENICDVKMAVDILRSNLMKQGNGSSLFIPPSILVTPQSSIKHTPNQAMESENLISFNDGSNILQKSYEMSSSNSPSLKELNFVSSAQISLPANNCGRNIGKYQESVTINGHDSEFKFDDSSKRSKTAKPGMQNLSYFPKNVEDKSVRPKVYKPKPLPGVRQPSIPSETEDFNWDYVYKGLEKQGYTKDLGERGDILDRKPSHLDLGTKNGVVKTVSLSSIQKGKCLQQSPKNQRFRKSCNYDSSNVIKSKANFTNSSKDKLIMFKNDSPNAPKAQSDENTVSPAVESNIDKTDHTKGTHVNLKKLKSKENGNMETTGINKKWSCSFCTYLNGDDVEICEMCSRSKDRGVEVQPLVCGGRECPTCTLVNDKEAENCSACNCSLKDSPTYI